MLRRFVPWAILAAAQAAAAWPPPSMVAVRAEGPIMIDGASSEPSWARAPVFDAFVETYPVEGARPSLRTEVRVLYDDDRLYVAVRCYDRHRAASVERLAPRTRIQAGETVSVAVTADPTRRQRAGYFFTVNAAGEREDRILDEEMGAAGERDVVWEGAAARTDDGWSAELAIPLSALQFRPGHQVWGIYVERRIARTRQVLASVLIPRSEGALASRFGALALAGGETLRPRFRLDLQPFLPVPRPWSPRFPNDPPRPQPRLAAPSGGPGVDLYPPLTSDFQLKGVVARDLERAEDGPVVLGLRRFDPQAALVAALLSGSSGTGTSPGDVPSSEQPGPAPTLTAGPFATSGATTATIAYSTDVPTVDAVDYGETTAYGSAAPAGIAATEHSVRLSGLMPGRVYHYRAKATANGKSVASPDFTFTTKPPVAGSLPRSVAPSRACLGTGCGARGGFDRMLLESPRLGAGLEREAASRLEVEELDSFTPGAQSPADADRRVTLHLGRPLRLALRDRASRSIVAVRAQERIVLDGALDEAAWSWAPAFDDFVESYPVEGARPTLRTEVRVLYDDDRLYVGVRCEDPEPERVVQQLGRRDHIPPSDAVAVAVDATRNRRMGYFFAVNAAGVLEDRLLYDDTEEASEWDAVWDAATARTADGWSAELAIPLSALRFRPGDREWGVYVERKIARTHQVLASVLIPRSDDAFVSRFGTLTLDGGEALRPRLGLELQPFLVLRQTWRPQFSDPTRPQPRLSDPSADVGLDFRLPLTSDLQLNGAVNPDFGQVEADPVILNLTRFEPYFPEKRPFFLEGMDLFAPLGGEADTPQQLLYTRRIGLASPIVGAAKLSGRAASGLQLGVLNAFVIGAGGSPDEAHPGRGIAYRLQQPFHLSPLDAYPFPAPAPENFFAATLRADVGSRSTVGAHATLATPIGPACTAEDLQADVVPSSCTTLGGAALAGDWDLRSDGGAYALTGQAAVSAQLAGPPARTLDDGTVLRRGDVGFGGWFTLGKTGGEPWRLFASYVYAGPRLDLNAAGYQPDQNLHAVQLNLRYVRSRDLSWLRAFSSGLRLSGSMSADGRALGRGQGVRADAKITTPGYHEVGCDLRYDDPRFDLREIVASGIAYQRPPSWDGGCTLQTNLHARVAFELTGRVLRTVAAGPLRAGTGWQARVASVVRPASWLETKVSAEVMEEPIPGRWLQTDGGELFFGDLMSRSLTLSLRQQAMLGPRLSLELYAQLLAASERYGPFYAAPVPPGAVVELDALRPTAPPPEPLDTTPWTLRVNTVLRWEYRPGSTIYLVYSRLQDSNALLGSSGRVPAASAVPGSLGKVPAIDIVLLKWTVWYSR